MKRIAIIIIALFAHIGLQAQIPGTFSDAALIAPLQLEITLHKTTMLIFPVPIQSADRGDSYVLAEKVKGAENVLKVKAGQKEFDQSSLQVITSDGKVYAFTVNYSDQPSSFTIDMRKQPPHAPVEFEGLSLNSAEIERYSALIAAGKPFLNKGKYSKNGMALCLEGVYIKDDVLFLRYLVKNKTGIRYDASSFRFYVRDKRISKRTAAQDNEVLPVYQYAAGKPEDGHGQTIIAVFPKFTIAEKKRFFAELTEQNGDRNPSSAINQSVLLKARPVKY